MSSMECPRASMPGTVGLPIPGQNRCEAIAWTGETEVQNRDERNLSLQFTRRQYVGCVVLDDFEALGFASGI
ncbi:LOW QUALITY PROTEIN: hypothetical protein IFM47457_03960 [Aspergillus lentulus]|nr:LOW QUALITY PROTEIN: hypothetical protein IFM47457_03960 [Aspergillus lentulus]